MMTKSERDLRTFEAIMIALAEEDAKHMPMTPELERQVDALYAAGHRRIAQIRYAENALWPVKVVSGAIRSEIQAMSRTEVVATLNAMRARHPQMQYAHRDCETVTDDDLRSMLEDAMRLLEDEG